MEMNGFRTIKFDFATVGRNNLFVMTTKKIRETQILI